MNDYLKTRELYHSGIKGMKWGIRRYQNEDGTLTEEGKKRYGEVGLKDVSLEKVKADLDDFEDRKTMYNEYIQEADKCRYEAKLLAQKHNLDRKGRARGSSAKEVEAAKKYAELQDRAYELENKYSREIAPIVKKKANDYITKKYGTYRVSKLKQKERMKRAGEVTAAAGFAALLALPAAYLVTR